MTVLISLSLHFFKILNCLSQTLLTNSYILWFSEATEINSDFPFIQPKYDFTVFYSDLPTKDAPKVMVPIHFQANYNRYKECNNIMG